jgi:hypothetical protein
LREKSGHLPSEGYRRDEATRANTQAAQDAHEKKRQADDWEKRNLNLHKRSR